MHSKISLSKQIQSPINWNRLKIPEYARGVLNKFLKGIGTYPYYSTMNMYLGWPASPPTCLLKSWGFFRTCVHYLTLPTLCSVPGSFCHHDEAFRVASLTLLQPPHNGLKKNLRKNLYFYTRVFSRFFFFFFKFSYYQSAWKFHKQSRENTGERI